MIKERKMKVQTIEVSYKASKDYNTAEARWGYDVGEGYTSENIAEHTKLALAKCKKIAEEAVGSL